MWTWYVAKMEPGDDEKAYRTAERKGYMPTGAGPSEILLYQAQPHHIGYGEAICGTHFEAIEHYLLRDE